jgi:hypothetical protein
MIKTIVANTAQDIDKEIESLEVNHIVKVEGLSTCSMNYEGYPSEAHTITVIVSLTKKI